MAILDLSKEPPFGKLTAVRIDTDKSTPGKWWWVCRCECGGEKSISHGALRSGNTKTCGCSKKTGAIIGGSRTPTYISWCSMKQRCLGENHHAKNRYADRGITICQEWIDSYPAFLRDMGERPPGLTLDRIDNDKGYDKSNCRWASWKQQANNTRRNVLVTIGGVTKTVSEWVSGAGLKISSVTNRLKRMSFEEAITKPMRPKRKVDPKPANRKKKSRSTG